ncbi:MULTISPECIES: nucleotidyl transferase AbiEii/AbiGii toxin family protein [unclassified Mycoplasma]|uniref:nucleotidyl transferase AbiEii/AbiGii toxin family protein n=1 Tax=unclassified Mycoplasma TaxID=2683645 RepID=UPI00211CBCE2|nr:MULTISPECIES: nucleotidyl transferase AbiEii/AbiGii toxin family protein [unclassified Mycoplasma]UUM20147.1 nucleotidyl transferase AbiEii/AbiGii toxin family protein [Mycoplasma sp. 1578d]UUM25142.1 nucleotidyl transferase AbiEii/AbiGii toxin family protein [Mycoplasma sp. 3686d]
MEIGALSENVSSLKKGVKSYISEYYPNLFKGEISLLVTDPLITLFEKITILHREVHRTDEEYPSRYSRHFYYIYKLIQTELRQRSFNELDKFRSVIENKKRFFPIKKAKYDDIFLGEARLVPNEEAIKIFENDYRKMKSMLFGEIPTFEQIIDELKVYEIQLNNRIKSHKDWSKLTNQN